jgi:hypothetical protein
MNAYMGGLGGNPEGNRLLGRRLEDDIKVGLKEI